MHQQLRALGERVPSALELGRRIGCLAGSSKVAHHDARVLSATLRSYCPPTREDAVRSGPRLAKRAGSLAMSACSALNQAMLASSDDVWPLAHCGRRTTRHVVKSRQPHRASNTPPAPSASLDLFFGNTGTREVRRPGEQIPRVNVAHRLATPVLRPFCTGWCAPGSIVRGRLT